VEKIGVATEAFAAAKAGRSFCGLFGTTKGHALSQSAPRERFPQAVKSSPYTKLFVQPAPVFDIADVNETGCGIFE
jgi:hypothetical protein